MRFGIVKGRVVLSRVNPRLADARFLVVEAVTGKNLAAWNGHGGGERSSPSATGATFGRHGCAGGGEELVVADYLGPRTGSLVGFVEGREGSAPWAPDPAPVDAYLSLIVDAVDYHPKTKDGD